MNNFQILPNEQFNLTFSVIGTPFLFFVIILLIFFIGTKETIIIDKDKDEIQILLHRVIWAKIRKFKISQIKNLNYKQENYGSQFFIQYVLFNDKKGRLLHLYYKGENLNPIYTQLNNFLLDIKVDIGGNVLKLKNNLEI